MHACDLIRNTLKNGANAQEAERIKEVLRACPLRDGTTGSLINEETNEVDLTRIHPEVVSQLALHLQLRYVENIQWDRANQTTQLRASQERLQMTSLRLQELEREVERLKRDRERLTQALQCAPKTTRVSDEEVRERINAVRQQFTEEYRNIRQRYPNAEKAISECQQVEREVFKKLLHHQ
jgi:hypothetical protein